MLNVVIFAGTPIVLINKIWGGSVPAAVLWGLVALKQVNWTVFALQVISLSICIGTIIGLKCISNLASCCNSYCVKLIVFRH